MAGRTHRKAAATAHDGLIHAAKTQPNQADNAKPPQQIEAETKMSAITSGG